MIRHGTKYMETIKVKRTFMHPEYRFPLGYNDVALSELSRRVMFDFEKYGPFFRGEQKDLLNIQSMSEFKKIYHYFKYLEWEKSWTKCFLCPSLRFIMSV